MGRFPLGRLPAALKDDVVYSWFSPYCFWLYLDNTSVSHGVWVVQLASHVHGLREAIQH